MKKTKNIVYLMTALLITSCASLGSIGTVKTYNSIDEVNQYRVFGRSAVRSPQFNGQVTLSFEQQKKGYMDIVLSGALGKGRTELSITPERSTIEYDNRTFHGDNPDQLFQQITDIDWPVSGTIDWLKGHPRRSDTTIHYDETNRPLAFEEDGWQIRYQEWMETNGLRLPKRITVTRGDVRLRLFIENWEI